MRFLSMLALVFALAGGAFAADPPPAPLDLRLVATEGGQPTPQLEGGELLLEAASLLSRDDIRGAKADGTAVQVELTPAGTTRFAEATTANVGRKMAIMLDDRVSSDPIFNSRIPGGRVRITMGETPGMTVREAANGDPNLHHEIAFRLNAWWPAYL